MATTIKLPEHLVNQARRYGEAYSRSTPKQIEYWFNIGKIAEETSFTVLGGIDDFVAKEGAGSVVLKIEAGMDSGYLRDLEVSPKRTGKGKQSHQFRFQRISPALPAGRLGNPSLPSVSG